MPGGLGLYGKLQVVKRDLAADVDGRRIVGIIERSKLAVRTRAVGVAISGPWIEPEGNLALGTDYTRLPTLGNRQRSGRTGKRDRGAKLQLHQRRKPGRLLLL